MRETIFIVLLWAVTIKVDRILKGHNHPSWSRKCSYSKLLTLKQFISLRVIFFF